MRYAPLYHHSFKLRAPHKVLEAHKARLKYRSIREIDNFPDRLRWSRHQLGLTQKEMAELVGVSRSVYLNLETGAVDYCDREIADALAATIGVTVDELLDDYNRFIYHGQGRAICRYRKQLGMGKKPFARFLGVSDSSIREWEADRKQVSRKSWEKHFRGQL